MNDKPNIFSLESFQPEDAWKKLEGFLANIMEPQSRSLLTAEEWIESFTVVFKLTVVVSSNVIGDFYDKIYNFYQNILSPVREKLQDSNISAQFFQLFSSEWKLFHNNLEIMSKLFQPYNKKIVGEATRFRVRPQGSEEDIEIVPIEVFFYKMWYVHIVEPLSDLIKTHTTNFIQSFVCLRENVNNADHLFTFSQSLNFCVRFHRDLIKEHVIDPLMVYVEKECASLDGRVRTTNCLDFLNQVEVSVTKVHTFIDRILPDPLLRTIQTDAYIEALLKTRLEQINCLLQDSLNNASNHETDLKSLSYCIDHFPEFRKNVLNFFRNYLAGELNNRYNRPPISCESFLQSLKEFELHYKEIISRCIGDSKELVSCLRHVMKDACIDLEKEANITEALAFYIEQLMYKHLKHKHDQASSMFKFAIKIGLLLENGDALFEKIKFFIAERIITSDGVHLNYVSLFKQLEKDVIALMPDSTIEKCGSLKKGIRFKVVPTEDATESFVVPKIAYSIIDGELARIFHSENEGECPPVLRSSFEKLKRNRPMPISGNSSYLKVLHARSHGLLCYTLSSKRVILSVNGIQMAVFWLFNTNTRLTLAEIKAETGFSQELIESNMQTFVEHGILLLSQENYEINLKFSTQKAKVNLQPPKHARTMILFGSRSGSSDDQKQTEPAYLPTDTHSLVRAWIVRLVKLNAPGSPPLDRNLLLTKLREETHPFLKNTTGEQLMKALKDPMLLSIIKETRTENGEYLYSYE